MATMEPHFRGAMPSDPFTYNKKRSSIYFQ